MLVWIAAVVWNAKLMPKVESNNSTIPTFCRGTLSSLVRPIEIGVWLCCQEHFGIVDLCLQNKRLKYGTFVSSWPIQGGGRMPYANHESELHEKSTWQCHDWRLVANDFTLYWTNGIMRMWKRLTRSENCCALRSHMVHEKVIYLQTSGLVGLWFATVLH